MSELNHQLHEFVMRLRDAELRLNKLADRAGGFVQSADLFRPADNGGAPPPPPPPPTPVIRCGGCCSGLGMPASIPFVDSVYGPGTLVWDGTSTWTACLSVTLGGSGVPCGFPVFAIQYVLSTTCQLTMSWVVNNTSHCPVTSSCPPTAGAGQSVNSFAVSASSSSCGTNPATVTFTNPGSTTADLLLHAGFVSQTVTLSIAAGAGSCTPATDTIRGCRSLGIGTGVTVTITSGGTTLWTGSTNASGVYVAGVMLSMATTVTITAVDTTGRLATGAITTTLVPGVSGGGDITLVPAAGYKCFATTGALAACSRPITTTLTATANTCNAEIFPGDTLTWQSAPPAYAVTGGAPNHAGWLGAAAFALGGSGAFPTGNYSYWFSEGTMYVISPSVLPGGGPTAQLLASGFTPTCPPSTFNWATTCTVAGTWGGRVHE